MTNHEKADQLLTKELVKEEKESGMEYTHNETLTTGSKIFTYYVIFNDLSKEEKLFYYTYTVNIKTKKVSRKVRRANL